MILNNKKNRHSLQQSFFDSKDTQIRIAKGKELVEILNNRERDLKEPESEDELYSDDGSGNRHSEFD